MRFAAIAIWVAATTTAEQKDFWESERCGALTLTVSWNRQEQLQWTEDRQTKRGKSDSVRTAQCIGRVHVAGTYIHTLWHGLEKLAPVHHVDEEGTVAADPVFQRPNCPRWLVVAQSV
jgi:hypothetical protein